MKTHTPKEVPFLMSTEMVKAILAGRKTQTRRVIKDIHPDSVAYPHDHIKHCFIEPDEMSKAEDVRMVSWVKPKCQVGDLIWVRESFIKLPREGYYWYKAIHPLFQQTEARESIIKSDGLIWKPSIHMPKDAARIWLRCTGVRAERLHYITENDALAEGVSNADTFKGIGVDDSKANRYAFRQLWQSINSKPPKLGKVDGRWDANPWVWVYSFELVSTTGFGEVIIRSLKDALGDADAEINIVNRFTGGQVDGTKQLHEKVKAACKRTSQAMCATGMAGHNAGLSLREAMEKAKELRSRFRTETSEGGFIRIAEDLKAVQERIQLIQAPIKELPCYHCQGGGCTACNGYGTVPA